MDIPEAVAVVGLAGLEPLPMPSYPMRSSFSPEPAGLPGVSRNKRSCVG